MLSMTSYGQEYIDACRTKIDAQVAAYRRMAASRDQDDTALRDFEPVFFNNMVIVLENYFVHRARGQEKKDGNPLNEVRLLSTSMTSNDGRLVSDKQIKLDPARSVLGHHVGDEIEIRQEDFLRLAKAFLAEIETKFR